MAYYLYREGDKAGDFGSMSQAIFPVYDDNQKIIDTEIEDNSKPKIGAAMRVGTHGSRSFASQDYWTTTLVTEILEESEKRVRFATRNSIYLWEMD